MPIFKCIKYPVDNNFFKVPSVYQYICLYQHYVLAYIRTSQKNYVPIRLKKLNNSCYSLIVESHVLALFNKVFDPKYGNGFFCDLEREILT